MHSVGVAAQYASALGKTANCQTLVSLTLARGEVPVTLALRLFLPESWTSNRARLQRAGIPGRTPNCTDEAGAGSGRAGSCRRGRCTFWLRLGGCWLWAERAVPPGAHGPQIALGGGHSASSQGLPCRCADDLAGCQARSSPQAVHSRCSIETGRRYAGSCQRAQADKGKMSSRAHCGPKKPGALALLAAGDLEID